MSQVRANTGAPMPNPFQPELEDDRYSGEPCHRCGAPLLDGVSFDVQWRLEGSDGSVLQSDCFTVTVK